MPEFTKVAGSGWAHIATQQNHTFADLTERFPPPRLVARSATRSLALALRI